MRRRDFLVGSGAGLVSAGMSLPIARAGVSAADRKFIFILCGGGWDPAMVFAPSLGDGDVVDRESDSFTMSAGNISYVSSPARPSIDAFFTSYADHTLLFNGLEVRNVDHHICSILTKTGDTGGDSPDWATIIAQAGTGDFIIPHLVLGGPAFAGSFPTAVVRTSSDVIYHMLGGSLAGYSDLSVPSFSSQDILDAHIAGRQASLLAGNPIGRRRELIENMTDSLDTMQQAEPYRDIIRGSSSLSVQVQNAVQVLSNGLSRSVSLSQTYNDYDTHSSNYYYQDSLLSELFSTLDELMQLLATTPGTAAATLLEETTVVVQSEMGKTPQLNSGSGKDHWPFTTTMLLGSGFTGNRVVGGYTEALGGCPIDFASGELDDGGSIMTATSIGATLLAMGDVDPGDWALDSEPIDGVLG